MEYQVVRIVENNQISKNNKLKNNCKITKENCKNSFKEKDNYNKKKELKNSNLWMSKKNKLLKNEKEFYLHVE